MKINIPVNPPEELDFPGYIGWIHSNILIPYPLYIITTVDEDGIPNAQPNMWGLPFGDKFGQFFIFYDWACHHTVQNVIATKEFVINVPSEDQVPQVMRTVESYPRGTDEIAASGLTAVPSTNVKPPRVKECRAHFECRLSWHKQTHARPAYEKDDVGVLVLGKIVAASGDRDVLAGTAEERIQRMRTVFLLQEYADAINMKFTSSNTYGTIDKLKDFDKLEDRASWDTDS
jgi:flavin reductase (DIM6/NTAB) family NADH-FMN oxidoreductase RutF